MEYRKCNASSLNNKLNPELNVLIIMTVKINMVSVAIISQSYN